MGLFDRKKSEPSPVVKVKLMGVRTAENTGVMATYNSTLYCFLLQRADGSRELVEYSHKDKELADLLPLIPMD